MESQFPDNQSLGISGEKRKSRGILIAVEDPVQGELLGRFVGKEGHTFEMADSWHGVLETIRFFQPEAVILGNLSDLPSGKNGIDEIRVLTDRDSLPVLVLFPPQQDGNSTAIHLNDPLNWEELGRNLGNLAKSEKGKSALLINSDALFNSVLARQFERAGWNATQVPHIQAAKQRIGQSAPDLIFMETQPGINEILSIMRDAPDVPLFLLATRKLSCEDEARLSQYRTEIFRPGHFSLKELKEALDRQTT